MKLKLFILLFVMLISNRISFGQSDVEMADVMRSNGKIYVVVAVAAIVMLGILFYLITLDRKITRIEKEINKKA